MNAAGCRDLSRQSSIKQTPDILLPETRFGLLVMTVGNFDTNEAKTTRNLELLSQRLFQPHPPILPALKKQVNSTN